MRLTLLCLSIFVLPIAAASPGDATACDLPAQLQAAQTNSLVRAFRSVFLGAAAKGIDCGSIASVWQKVALSTKTGGRKLEANAPLDINVARQQWEGALRDKTVAARLNAAASGTESAAEVAIYQAAILDEEGLYSARDAWVVNIATVGAP